MSCRDLIKQVLRDILNGAKFPPCHYSRITWNLMFNNQNICFFSSWQTAAVGIREWCKKNTSCTWKCWKCTRQVWCTCARRLGLSQKGNRDESWDQLAFVPAIRGWQLCVQETFWISDLQNQVGVSYRISRTDRFQRFKMCKNSGLVMTLIFF